MEATGRARKLKELESGRIKRPDEGRRSTFHMEYKENALTYEDYIRLRESVNWLNFSKEQAERGLANSLYDVVAIEGGNIIGMGRMVGDGLYNLIVDVVVCPEYQKRGIGTGLMKRLTKYAKECTPPGGRTSLQLIAEKGKEPFYEKMGFKKIPHEFCGSGMRKVIYQMEKA